MQVEILQQPGHPETPGGYPTSDSQEELLPVPPGRGMGEIMKSHEFPNFPRKNWEPLRGFEILAHI